MERYDRVPYAQTVAAIRDKLLNAKCTTLQGTKMIDEMYRNINESDTPLLSLKRFISGGEVVAAQDASVKDVLEFTKKAVTGNVDLNFLINLCKEEHLDTLTKSGHPAPKETLKTVEKLFSGSASTIEQAIKSGVFDDLKSELYMKVSAGLKNPKVLSQEKEAQKHKQALAAAAGVDLKESQKTVIGDGFIRYCPIGFMVKGKTPKENTKQIALLEGQMFYISKGEKSSIFDVCHDSIELNPTETRMAIALSKQPYNPKTGCFRLFEDWDFDMWLTPKGEVKIAKVSVAGAKPTIKAVSPEHVKGILFESIDYYLASQKIKDAAPYLADADNFMALMENNNKLIHFDNLMVFKNLNEGATLNDFVIVPAVQQDKLKMFHNGMVLLFESYTTLRSAIDNAIKTPVVKLFESEIKKEEQSKINDLLKVGQLNETLKTLNESITRVNKLKSLAEDGSPAMRELDGQYNILNGKLQETLKELSQLTPIM
jgi:hypothetical protein